MLLFLANVVVLIIIGIWAYSTGSPYNMFRTTDLNNNVCGLKNSFTENYPFVYFYNPSDLNKRVCVAVCPSYTNGVLSNLVCYGLDCKYTATVNQNGTPNGLFLDTSFIGYGSI